MSRVTGRPSRRLNEIRDRGFRGGRIAPHRAMIGLVVSWTLIVDMIVLPLIFAVAMFLLMDPLLALWRDFFNFVRVPLGLPGVVSTRVFEVGPLGIAVPYFSATAAWPERLDLLSGWLLTGVLFVAGLFLRGRWLPIGYLLRVLAVIQLTAQLWFSFASPPFVYSLPDYVSGLLVCGVVILILIPFLVGLTYHIFDFQLWQKLLMTALLLVHLSILLPLQAVIHTWIVHRASLLALPMLFLVFGVLLDVFVYVALYGWGMSWRSEGPLDAVDRQPPKIPDRYPPSRPRPTPTPRSVPAFPDTGRFTLALAGLRGLFGSLIPRSTDLDARGRT